jgi:hypothetical protein
MSLRTPIALIAVLAFSAACADGGGTVPGVSGVPVNVHAAMPGYKNTKEALGLGQPPVAAPTQPVIKPASVTFASSREFQEFPVQPSTNSIFIDTYAANVGNEYLLPPILSVETDTRVTAKPKMIATQYREVIPRKTGISDPATSTVYASTFGNVPVE